MKNRTYDKIGKFMEWFINRRVSFVTVIVAMTVVMAYFAAHIQVTTVFSDLLPRNHPYIQVNNQYKSTFGGSNMVTIMLQVDNGDIFQKKVLERIQNITKELQKVSNVDTYQIISLASRKLKEVRASADSIVSHPLMWPDLPQNAEEMRALKESVLNNPLVYGPYVSHDLKATIITADFSDLDINYAKIYQEISTIGAAAAGDGVQVKIVGEPILYGIVNHFLTETLYIFVITIIALILLLFLITRTWHGTVLPIVAGALSAIWALGVADLMGFHLDPLVIVVAFLITALAISNSVQLVMRFDYEIAHGAPSAATAAKASLQNLLKPGMLAIVADAGCVAVVALTPIPMLQTISYIGTVWVFSIAISAMLMTPVLLSWVSGGGNTLHPVNVSPALNGILDLCIKVVSSRLRYLILGATCILFSVSGVYALNLKVGDANPGSPILWPTSRYNMDATAINKQFLGSDRMFIVVAGEKQGTLKEPSVLKWMDNFQKYMEAQPEVGGSISLADILPSVNRVIHEGNARYQEFGSTADENGELVYMFVSGSDPGDMDRFSDSRVTNGAITLYFRDHQGTTINTAVQRIKNYVATNPIKDASIQLAGGLIGVLAAVNEVILSGQIESIAFALLVLFVCCAIAYRSIIAGLFFMIPVLLSNTLTFSYMAWQDIGMNINTLPVVALGIGLGVDYTFYIVDGIREELHRNGNRLNQAIANGLKGAGKGVLITAITMITSVIVWSFSSLRLQADMGILIAIWLGISATTALFVMPTVVYVFKPEFIVGGRWHPIEVPDAEPQLA